MLRPLMTCTLVFAIAPGLASQEKPTPAVRQAITGAWQFDQARSDTVSGDPLAGAADARSFGGRAGHSGGGGGGRDGGRGGRGGGGSVTVLPSDTTAPAARVERAGSRPRDPHLQIVLADVDPGAGIVIAANDSVVSLATAATVKSGAQSNWKTDGKKRQEAQMDGSIIETQAMWQGGVLTTIKGVAGVGSLKREFKLSKDGKALEVKERIEVSGRKVEKKLVFTRKQ